MNRNSLHITFAICALMQFANSGLHAQAKSWVYQAGITANIDLLTEGVSDTTVDLTLAQGALSDFVISATNGELHISWNMKDEWPEEITQSEFDLKAEFTLDGRPINVKPDQLFGDFGNNIQAAERKAFGLTVSGLLERSPVVAGVLNVTLVIHHHFVLRPKIDFDCVDGMPKFDFKQKVPYIGGAVIGAGLVTWGALTEVDAKDLHKQYFNADGQEDESLYLEANRQHKQAVGMMAAGGAILAASGILYYVRHRDFKRRSYLYETYCQEGNSIGFNPVFELPNNSITGGSAGLSMVYTF